jgi:hypothetical protein
MKKLLSLSLLLLSIAGAQATITINLGAANLYNANGSQLMQPGMLVQLIASTTDTTFNAPTSGSFTGGSSDDVVLASFTVNQGAGIVGQALVIDFANFANLNLADPFMIRWFPTLSGPTPPGGSPAAGTPFGQFRTDLVEANNFSNYNWTIPADGSTIDLNFLTQGQNPASTHPESEGFANLTVIPEPSTFALLALSAVGLAGYARRRKS